jgi:RNA polymerase sigma factor (sigma-70 family)
VTDVTGRRGARYVYMDRETEYALVRRIAGGDTAAFDAVYDEYRARLYSFLVRLSRRRDLAEDLLEETWLRLVEHAGRLRPGAPLGPWLFTVARNLYFSYCRSRSVEDERVAGLMGLWPGPARGPSPFEEASASELEARLERALAVLSPRYREVLLLALIEGMTPAEMARVCGVTPGVLRQRLSRARATLAGQLGLPTGRGTRSPAREVVV